MQPVVITGVSSGIGHGTASAFVQHTYPVFGTVRSTTDGERLRAEFGPLFTPLICDVTDQQSLYAAAATVATQVGGQGIAALINNAGIAFSGPLMHQPLAEVERHFAVNVTGLVAATQAFLPLLGASTAARHAPGRILNISSVGGRVASPFLAAYAASKHAVEGLSDSLRRELKLYGIDVIVVRPGAVRTAIWDKQGEQVADAYANTAYAGAMKRFVAYARNLERNGLTSEAFGQFIWRVFRTPRPRPHYTFAPNQLTNWLIPRFLPAAWLDRIITRNFGLVRAKTPVSA